KSELPPPRGGGVGQRGSWLLLDVEQVDALWQGVLGGWELGQGAQGKLLGEGGGGAVEDGLAGAGVGADLVDEAAGGQGPEHPVHVDASNGRDLEAGHRLAGGDHGRG